MNESIFRLVFDKFEFVNFWFGRLKTDGNEEPTRKKKPPKLDQGYSLLAVKWNNTSFLIPFRDYSIRHSVGWHLWCIFFSFSHLLLLMFVLLPAHSKVNEENKERRKKTTFVTDSATQWNTGMFRTSIAQCHWDFCNITAKKMDTAHYPIEIISSLVFAFWLIAMQFFSSFIHFSIDLMFECYSKWKWMMMIHRNQHIVQKNEFHHDVLQSFSIILLFVVVSSLLSNLSQIISSKLTGWMIGCIYLFAKIAKREFIFAKLAIWYCILLDLFPFHPIPYSYDSDDHLMTSSEHFCSFKNHSTHHSKSAVTKRRRIGIDLLICVIFSHLFLLLLLFSMRNIFSLK